MTCLTILPHLCISRLYVTFVCLILNDLSDHVTLFVHFQSVRDLLLVEHE